MRIIFNNDLIGSKNRLQLYIFDWGCANAGNEWCADVIKPSYSRLYFITGGDAWYQHNNSRHNLSAGKCYLLPSGLSFHHACETYMEQIFFHIALYQESGQDVLPFVDAPITTDFGNSVVENLKKLIATRPAGQIDYIKVECILMEIMYKLFKENGIDDLGSNYSPCVLSALQYIHHNITGHLTLSEVTERSFVSQTTLSKKFRQEVGESVGQYIEDQLMARAEHLLMEEKLTIGEISEQLGYCDQFHFSRRFRLRYSESPHSYRKKFHI